MADLTADELTDVTADWIHEQAQDEPHKGGWLVGDCWVDEHSASDHAATCADCRKWALDDHTRTEARTNG